MPARDRDKQVRRLRKMISQGQPLASETRRIRRVGLAFGTRADNGALRGSNEEGQWAAAGMVDGTVRTGAVRALQRSSEDLQQLVRQRTRQLRKAREKLKAETERRKELENKILEVSDREQQRLAQELHDGLCQHLTAVAFMARSVALRLKNHRVIDAADIDKIAELVNKAATDTRNLSRTLHRVDVDASNLAPALQDLIDREIWKTPCRLEIHPSLRLDNDAAAAQLYRIAREALINANKHAQARQIVVKLERSRRGEIILSVSDDGVGLRNAGNGTRGLGFQIMNYRARQLGGELKIVSPKTGGTRVVCHLPRIARRFTKQGRHSETPRAVSPRH